MDPYGENPFRVLSVRSTASIKDVALSSKRMLMLLELGASPPVNDVLSFLPSLQLDSDRVRRAMRRVEDPRSRIQSELFWLSADFLYFDACQQFLSEGRYRDFVAHCEYAISQEPTLQQTDPGSKERWAASLARHHLAVFYHSVAIAKARRMTKDLPPVNWETALHYWFLVWKDDLFWEYLANRASSLGDVRIKPEYSIELRSSLPKTILDINVTLGHEMLGKRDFTELLSQTKVINSSPFSRRQVAEAFEALALPLREQFEKVSKDIHLRLSDSSISEVASALTKSPSSKGFIGTLDQEKLRPFLAEMERSINRKVISIADQVKEANLQNTELGVEILDGTAYLLRTLSIVLNNHADLSHQAWRVANIAQEYAVSEDAKERIAEDQKTLNFLCLQKDATDLAKAGRFRESLTKLEQAVRFAATTEERQTIEQWMEQARKLLAHENLRPINSAPSLRTINGIGTKLYGRRDVDKETNSYIATLFFTIFFIPIFPLAAYRVIDASRGMYKFLGKARLSRASFAPLGIWVFLLLVVIVGNTENNPGRMNYQASTPAVTMPSYAQSSSSKQSTIQSSPSDASNAPMHTQLEREKLGRWIDQARTRIDTEESELKKDEKELAKDGNALIERRNDLDRQQNDARIYGGDAPSDIEVDSYNAALRNFKSTAAAVKAREKHVQTEIDEFNRKVKEYNSMR